MQICVRANWLIIPLITIISMLINQWFMRTQWIWYFSLKLPPITPPIWVFGVAWTIIYILTTLCALLVFNLYEHTPQWYLIMIVFLANVCLHAMWPYIFFVRHQLGLAALNAGMLCITVWMLFGLIRKTSLTTALLLVPYGLWTTFATILGTWIYLLN